MLQIGMLNKIYFKRNIKVQWINILTKRISLNPVLQLKLFFENWNSWRWLISKFMLTCDCHLFINPISNMGHTSIHSRVTRICTSVSKRNYTNQIRFSWCSIRIRQWTFPLQTKIMVSSENQNTIYFIVPNNMLEH